MQDGVDAVERAAQGGPVLDLPDLQVDPGRQVGRLEGRVNGRPKLVEDAYPRAPRDQCAHAGGADEAGSTGHE